MDYLTVENKKELRELAERLSNQCHVNNKAEIIDELVRYAENNFAARPKTIKQRLKYWSKGTLSATFIYAFHYSVYITAIWASLLIWYPLPWHVVAGAYLTARWFYSGVIRMDGQKHRKENKK